MKIEIIEKDSPKYQIDQIVFYKVGNDVRCAKVVIISFSRGAHYYHVSGASDYWTKESQLYSSFEEIPER
jgi:hypothetical protein